MLKSDFFKKLTAELCNTLPTHVQSIKKDFEKQCQNVLKQAFNKLDIVSRDEFDAQSKVLQRTRKKLEDLELLVKDLEKLLSKKRSRS
jgi:ubiquinone biosynthesis accessory factor UbiK